jgi:hypothetical protein
MIEFLDSPWLASADDANDQLWKPKEYFEKNKICSLCYGGPHLLNISHVSNAIHRNNVSKLGDLEWWKIPPNTLYDYLHSKKTTKSYRGKK